jgi:hypothetical protein
VPQPSSRAVGSPGPEPEEAWSGDLLLWLLRRRGEGDGAHRAIRVNLRHALGPVRGERGAAAFASFSTFLARHARRPLRFGPTGAEPASADERAVLALVACAARGAETEARARARWLVSEGTVGGLVTAARELVAAFA